MPPGATATTLQLLGAFAFGLVIGWFTYFVNRYRKGDVQLTDVLTIVGAVGGGAILTLFPEGTDLFGAYGIGLAVGFFAYFAVLLVLVAKSPNFTRDWFLDGRRKAVEDGWTAGDQGVNRPMERKDEDILRR
jgi:uncharacterized membrane protein YeaQ/YmgE (transglycosylase-associated protein family)